MNDFPHGLTENGFKLMFNSIWFFFFSMFGRTFEIRILELLIGLLEMLIAKLELFLRQTVCDKRD